MGTSEADLRAIVDKLVADYQADLVGVGAYTDAMVALEKAQKNVDIAKAASDAAQKVLLDDLDALKAIAAKYADNDPTT